VFGRCAPPARAAPFTAPVFLRCSPAGPPPAPCLHRVEPSQPPTPHECFVEATRRILSVSVRLQGKLLLATCLRVQALAQVRRALAPLPAGEAAVIRLRFGFGDQGECPLEGVILGLTEPAVHRLQASSLRKLVVQLAPDRPVRRVICSRVVVRLQSAGIDPVSAQAAEAVRGGEVGIGTDSAGARTASPIGRGPGRAPEKLLGARDDWAAGASWSRSRPRLVRSQPAE